MGCYVNVKQVMLVDNEVKISYISTDFLAPCSIKYWDILNYICGLLYLYKSMLHVFWSFIIQCRSI